MSLKRAIDACYSPLLPKGTHPFAYVALEIEPHRLDVNVHPTKREVHFLDEDEIISEIVNAIQLRLTEADVSRSFKTQTLYAGVTPFVPTPSQSSAGGKFSKLRSKPYEKDLVRTDSKARKITGMMTSRSGTDTSEMDNSDNLAYGVEVHLSSILELRNEVKESMHYGATELFALHTFVGIVDESRTLAAIQHGVKLYLIDYSSAAFHLFYQLGLTSFSNFGRICLEPPLSISDLLGVVEDERWAETALTKDSSLDRFLQKRTMLAEYFSLDISEDGMLSSMPLLLSGYIPQIGKMPNLLYCMVSKVDWSAEKPCFEGLLSELARFHVPEIPPEQPDESTSLTQQRTDIRQMTEQCVFSAFKRRFLAPKSLLSTLTEIADLPGLYRIFERC